MGNNRISIKEVPLGMSRVDVGEQRHLILCLHRIRVKERGFVVHQRPFSVIVPEVDRR